MDQEYRFVHKIRAHFRCNHLPNRGERKDVPMPPNQTDDYRNKNKELVRQNTKHTLRIRKLEHEIISLKEQLLHVTQTMNVPMYKIKQVVKATLNEYDSLQSAIQKHSVRFDEHARQGLLAILYYDSDHIQPTQSTQKLLCKKEQPPTREYRTKKRMDFQPTKLDSIEEIKSLIPVLSPKKT
jgi:hypothetical protein